MRSTSVARMHNRGLSEGSVEGSTLPVIEEDGNSLILPRAPPPVPPRAWNRPIDKMFGLGPSPRLEHDSNPPGYSELDTLGVEGLDGEKLPEVRKGRIANNKHIAKRGGWTRLLLIALAMIVCLVGLIVGLVVGLRKHKSSSYGFLSQPWYKD